jgi:hypothetical protein
MVGGEYDEEEGIEALCYTCYYTHFIHLDIESPRIIQLPTITLPQNKFSSLSYMVVRKSGPKSRKSKQAYRCGEAYTW